MLINPQGVFSMKSGFGYPPKRKILKRNPQRGEFASAEPQVCKGALFCCYRSSHHYLSVSHHYLSVPLQSESLFELEAVTNFLREIN